VVANISLVGIPQGGGYRILCLLVGIQHVDHHRRVVDLAQYFVKHAVLTEAANGADQRRRLFFSYSFHTGIVAYRYALFRGRCPCDAAQLKDRTGSDRMQQLRMCGWARGWSGSRILDAVRADRLVVEPWGRRSFMGSWKWIRLLPGR